MHALFKRILTVLLTVALLATALSTVSCRQQRPLDEISIDVLKIGKADCIVIQTGSGIVMIDTGEKENLSAIRAYMQERQYKKIDVLILSHYDKDHIGGVNEIVADYGVTTVIEPHVTDDTAEYVAYHETLAAHSVSVQKPLARYTFALGDCTFEVDVPQKKHYKVKHDNNISLIVSMRYGEKSFLFCGDAMETRLEEWIACGYGAHDFVKLPYHGNDLPNYADFLDVCKPSYAAITCSKKNPPAGDVLSLLEQYGTSVYLTLNGTVHVTTDGYSISITQ